MQSYYLNDGMESKMAYEDLMKLISHLDQSDISYIDYKSGTEQIILSKEVPNLNVESGLLHEPSQTVAKEIEMKADTVIPKQIETVEEPVSEVKEEKPEKNDDYAVKSPMVGVTYLQPQPDADVYVNVGDRVEKGDVICIIEAMKLMNEIQAPHSGVVTDIVVENEEVVEYNQPLIYIEP